jgi:hypothetical protein
MEELLNPNNAQQFDKVFLYFGAILGMGGFFWLLYRVAAFIGTRTNAIINAILEVLKRLEIAVEVLKKNGENSEKRLTRLEDHVYGNLTKSTKR